MPEVSGTHDTGIDRRSRARLVAAIATPVALLVSGALVWHSTNAAFTAQITNNASSWTAGTVVLQGDDGSNSATAAKGSALFTATNMKPGDTASKCLVITYNGSITTVGAVKLFVKPADLTGDTGLQGQLNFVVKEGTGGSAASCTGFSPTGTVYTGTLAAMPTTYLASTAGKLRFKGTRALLPVVRIDPDVIIATPGLTRCAMQESGENCWRLRWRCRWRWVLLYS